MTTLYLNNGSVLKTENLPDNYEDVYCSSCGCRLGWFNNAYADPILALCDYCMADKIKNDQDD